MSDKKLLYSEFVQIYNDIKVKLQNNTIDYTQYMTPLERNIIRSLTYHPNKEFLYYTESFPEIIPVPKYKKKFKQIENLKKQPNIEQRTPEWFLARYNCITASSGASALDENPYDGSSIECYLREKCNPNHPFELSNPKSYYRGLHMCYI